ncbi:MAG: IgA Peptidase M64 [Odoribacteraceae bacterium]|jgi:hypothetical protein|nr:IgA Peptidase M64 [Odoribacteraceae bacterium]
MKNIITLLVTCGVATLPAAAQTGRDAFDARFENKALRLDFVHAGDREGEEIFFDEAREEPHWGGPVRDLVDTTFCGNYYVHLRDLRTGELLYSRGFCTLFGEWRGTDEARSLRRAAPGTVRVPYPRADALVEILARDAGGEFREKFRHVVRVNDPFIKRERVAAYPTRDIHVTGDPTHRVDIVLLPDGYAAGEMEKFVTDCEAFTRGLFAFAPYSDHAGLFNVRAVLAPSRESGADVPREGAWKNTLLNTSFYTLGTERYLMTYDHKALRDLAANVPYDFIYVIVNTGKYGGGAIYNHYGCGTSGNLLAAKVHVHEFCHLFAGLGDEYAEDGAYNDMYPPGVEPWEANLTTLVHFEKKWQDLLDAGTPVPTPLDPARPTRTGVYEGAGYAFKGVYRPRPDCLMRTLRGDDFCPACTRAIVQQIHRYAE